MGVVAAAEVLGLGEDFDHGGEGEDGGLFGVEGDEAVAEAGAGGEVVVLGAEVFFVAGGAVLGERGG